MFIQQCLVVYIQWAAGETPVVYGRTMAVNRLTYRYEIPNYNNVGNVRTKNRLEISKLPMSTKF